MKKSKDVMLNSFQHPLHFLHAHKVEILKQVQDDKMIKTVRAFTLMELLVAVLIIGVLAAVAVPQYKKAVLKSRFSTLMPIGKSLAQGNEVYYLGMGEYTTQKAKLDIEGQASYPEGVTIELATDPEYLSYVRVANPDKVPNARYVVYQKHSANFADTTMCEANDESAKELCQTLGGVFVSENGTEARWASYLLSGELGVGDAFKEPCPENAVCNENDEVIGCNSGYYLYDGSCRVSHIGDYDYAEDSVCTGACNTNTFGDNASCEKQGKTTTYCHRATFTDNAMCSSGALCTGTTFNGESSCSDATCDSSQSFGTTKFMDHASCTNKSSCYGAAFSGESTCDGGVCNSASSYGIATFTDNARCLGNSRCQGVVFSGNSSCTSTYYNSGTLNSPRTEGGCSANHTLSLVSTFKDNAVCAGTGCDTANYEGNACCATSACAGQHIRKCTAATVNGKTTYTHYGDDFGTADQYWDDPAS